MTIAHPGLLIAGLLAVALPIVIHILFRRRRKPIAWAAMRFLLDAYRQQRRRTQLQQIILLTLRCLLIALVALALARPMLNTGGALGGSGGRTVYILIDSSLASAATDTATGTTSLDRSLDAARGLIDGLGQGDRAAIITMGSPAEALVLPASADVAGLRSVLDRIESTAASADVSGALALAAGDLDAQGDDAGSVTIAVLSPFTRGVLDVTAPLPAVLSRSYAEGGLTLVRIPTGVGDAQAPLGNAWVSGVEPVRRVLVPQDAAGSDRTVVVTIERDDSSERQALPVRLLLANTDDQAGDEPVLLVRDEVVLEQGERSASKRLTLGSGAIEVLRNATGQGVLTAQLDRDPNDLDNAYATPIAVRDAIRVGMVARRNAAFGVSTQPAQQQTGAGALSEAQWWRLALVPDNAGATIEVVTVEPAQIDRPMLLTLDALVLAEPDLIGGGGWDLIGAFARAGGMVIVTPAADAQTQLWVDNFERVLGFSFTLSREPAPLVGDPPRVQAPEVAPTLLRVVGAELEEIAPTAAALRWLTIERSTAANTDAEQDAGYSVLLELDSDAGRVPWVLAAAAPTLNEQTLSAGGLVVVFTSAVDIDWTTLPLSSLMVPLAQELIRQGVGESGAATRSTAGARWKAPRSIASIGLEAVDASINDQAIVLSDAGVSVVPVRSAGLVRITGPTGSLVALDAINPSPGAGDTIPVDERALDATLAGALGSDDPSSIQSIDAGSPASALRSSEDGEPISMQLLIAALLVALLELVLARVFSVPERGRASMIDRIRTAVFGTQESHSPVSTERRAAHREDAA